MDVAGVELAAAMHVAEEVAENCEGGCEDLRGDVPSAFGQLLKKAV